MDPYSLSPELEAANKLLRRTLKPMLKLIPSQAFLNWIAHMRRPAKGAFYDAAKSTWVKLGNIECLKVTPDVCSADDTHILYFHGGAYTLGSPAANEADARRMAISCGMTVLSVKYTTAINAPYPAAVNDAEAAYTALLATGVPASADMFSNPRGVIEGVTI